MDPVLSETGRVEEEAEGLVRRYNIAVVEKAIDVLEAFDGEGTLSLNEIARKVGQPKPSVFRLVATLVDRGFLEPDEQKDRYRLGLHLAEVARGALARLTLRNLARPFLRQLRDDFGYSANLAAITRNEVLFVEVLPGLHAMRMETEPGSRAELHATAAGKAIAAHLSEPELERYLGVSDLRVFTPRTITNRAMLREELARIRTDGYAVDHEERELGARCIGAAIRGMDGGIEGAISISSVSARLDGDLIPRVGAAVRAACDRISEGLGFRPS
jgi:IclR family acetate operon transcriptional repressor